MVNKTISALSPITGGSVEGDDLLIIADTSDSAIAKKITRNQFFVNVPPLVVTGSITVEGPRDSTTETYPPSRLTLDTTGGKGDNFFYSYDVTTDADVETPGIMTWNAESHGIFTGTTIANMTSRLNIASDGDITLAGAIDITGTVDITGNTELLGTSKLTVAGVTSLKATDVDGALTAKGNDISTTSGGISTTSGSISSSTGNISTTSGKVTGGTGVIATTGGITASAGDIIATTGNITVTAGSVTAGAGKVTGGTGLVATSGGVLATSGGVTATAGNITATAGSITAGTSISADTSITAGNTIVASAGNITATTGKVIGGGGLVATTGGVTATAGGMTVTAGDLTVTAGDIAVSGTVDDRDIAKNIPETFGSVGQVLTIKDATSVEWKAGGGGGTTNDNIVDNDSPEGVRIQVEAADRDEGRSLLIDAVTSTNVKRGMRITTLSDDEGGANIYTTLGVNEAAVMKITANNTRMLGGRSSFRPPQVSASNRANIDPVLQGSLVATNGDLWINTTGAAGAENWSRVGKPDPVPVHIPGPGTAGAWVNFNGSTLADTGNFNVATITRTSNFPAGSYDITFDDNLRTGAYAVVSTANNPISGAFSNYFCSVDIRGKTNSGCTVRTGYQNVLYDSGEINLAFFDFVGA